LELSLVAKAGSTVGQGTIVLENDLAPRSADITLDSELELSVSSSVGSEATDSVLRLRQHTVVSNKP
jgi:hypothetical protein